MASDIVNPLVPTHPLENLAWKSDYTLSEDSQTEFRDLLEGLHDILSQHDAKIARVQATLDQLLEERKSYMLRIDKLNSAIAPHKKLPPELLSKIFQDCSPSPLELPDTLRGRGLPTSSESILSLMTVCSRWREIALSSRDLWDEVYIEYPDLHSLSRWAKETGIMTEKAQKIISRGTRSIAVSLYSGRGVVPPKDIDPMRNLIIPFSHQLTHISLACCIHHLYDFLQSASRPFPILESLTFKGKNPPAFPHEPQSRLELGMFKNTPNLKTLEIRNFGLSDHLMSMHVSEIRLPWDQLTKMDFRDTWLDVSSAHWLLSQCSSAVSYRLSLLHTTDNPHDTLPATIVQPRLQSLSIGSNTFEEPNVTVQFLQSLTLPSLRSFEITDLHVEDSIPGLLSLITRSYCVLINLSMPKAQIPALVLDPLLELLPALEDLNIPKAIIPIPTLERMARGVLLPTLKSITCTIQSSPRSLESFMDAVERTGAEELGVTRLQDASARFPPAERHYKAARWPQAIQRFQKLVEKLSKEGRSISLPKFHGIV